ncbi:MAG TPA: hypothetical protein VIA18_15010 [Polyangia bacterium]|nr:hypothetical protein [Polyangia bacterium]
MDASSCDWPQWGQSALHDETSCAVGQLPTRTLDDITYDPFVQPVVAGDFGLTTHYQVPLIVGNDVYVELKTGSYTPCNAGSNDTPAGCGWASWNNEIWNEAHYTIDNEGTLTRDWIYTSDWKPEQSADFFEPVFHAAVFGSYIYVPAVNGAVDKVDRRSGKLVQRYQPYLPPAGQVNFVAGPLVADKQGNIYYNILTVDSGFPWVRDASGKLVQLTPKGTANMVDYGALVPDAPLASDLCISKYDVSYPLPWPPPDANGMVPQPAATNCGSQRPGINIAPAIGPDGTIYTASRAHFNAQYSYLIAVTPQMTPKWATSLRNLVNDGCGVLSPSDGQALSTHCAIGAPMGVDPATGQPPAIEVSDSSSSTPVVLPDGDILYGGLTYYNDFGGHLLKFDPNGNYLANFQFGWDVTPAIQQHDGTYSIITKDNLYGQDYDDQGTYYIRSLNPYLQSEWTYQSTNTKDCTRDSSGNLTCVDDHPNGFEWCINAPAVDAAGNIYGNSEDGNMYVLDAHGNLKTSYFLNQAIAAAYTPVALDGQGRIFALNSGHLMVLGGDAAQ